MNQIAFFQALAARAAETGAVAGAPPCPDADLLDCCEGILTLLSKATEIDRGIEGLFHDLDRGHPNFSLRAAEIERSRDALRRPLESRAKAGMRRACRLPIRTGAGIFAVASVIRASKTGAPLLGRHLAEALIDNPALRAAVWPACGSAGEVG